LAYKPRGLYWDDFEKDAQFETSRRTVTEADVALFAGLSGDYNPLHTDEEFARTTPFGRRAAHGLLVLSIASGLANQLALFEGTTISLLDVSARWTAPTFPGDTIHARITVTDTRASSKPDRGLLDILVQVFNQNGTLVMESPWKVLLKRRQESPVGSA
jgi:acyl dehydratase